MITKFGKRFLISALAGVVDFNSKEIAIGIANGTDYALADTNTRLGFEFFRLPVTLGSIDIQPDGSGGYLYYAVYKATIPQDIRGTIKEIGLYPGARLVMGTDGRSISDFEDTLLWKDSSGFSPALIDDTVVTPRISSYTTELKFPGTDTSNSSREYKMAMGEFNLSNYSVNDTLSIAFNRADTNSSKIRIKFYSSDTDYYYGDFSFSGLSTGNYIKEISMADVYNNTSGSPSSSQISYIGIELFRTSNSSNSIVYMDGLRINDEDTFNPAYGLISRSVLGSPIEKVAGRPIDIEYKIELSF